jgi:very-short-patch-repair endonuclease
MEKPFLEYNIELKERSRNLRNNSTLSEVLLWNKLKSGKMMGYKFNRQKPLLNYIVDFYCKKLKLVIEIDGCSHRNKYDRDLIRQRKLEALDLNFLRFDDLMVKKDMFNVIRNIEIYIEEFERLNPPNPLLKGGIGSVP